MDFLAEGGPARSMQTRSRRENSRGIPGTSNGVISFPQAATFRSLLDETGAPLKVQQELMRHADIRTTMNVYGKAMDAIKRKAHGKVVRLVLPAKVA